ncbi:leptin-like [Syngnathoides biaculeatus]|uniref:leptin-like n=1 Tax=Syngnathoides biaculeatus TaxID=300417 RepID=UPI002ADE949B|nr:leptin-like [Syngnathoides biaculeatus]XP_061679424.1 leptin-like [Syngnathoides biaculeatus]
MDCITLAILVSVSQVWGAATAAPMPMKVRVKWMSEQLLVKLNKIKVSAGVTLTPPVDQLDGLSSVVALLDGYGELISDSQYLSQVKTEISSLKGTLTHLKQGRCAGEAKANRTSAAGGPLQRLQGQRNFVLTVSMEALLRVKDILTRLLAKMENLDKC